MEKLPTDSTEAEHDFEEENVDPSLPEADFKSGLDQYGNPKFFKSKDVQEVRHGLD